MTQFTHVDERGRPKMVDVGGKARTRREATALGRVVFPLEVADALRQSGFTSEKGPVFQTAIIAGVQAVKRTHELVPFCHPLPLDGCSIDIDLEGNEAHIRCTAKADYKTGVEMEAMTGVSVAALTIYDMCKAMSSAIRISDVHLLEKTGGKQGWVDLSIARYLP